MKSILWVGLLAGSVLLAGCSTERHAHHHGMMSMMMCGKCECKMGEPSKADKSVCKHCGHSMSEHKETPVEPKHEHQH